MKKLFNNIFSIRNTRKNGKKYKMITFLGLKFYIPIQTYMRGENNKILIKDELGNIKPLKGNIQGLLIEIDGNNNEIIIENPCMFENSKILIVGDNNKIDIEKTNYSINNFYFILNEGYSNRVLKIHENVSISGGQILLLRNNSTFTIGKDCLFSWGLTIMTHDSHTLLDSTTKEVLNNKTYNCSIGEHCWIGHDVTMHKKASIAKGTVVGACAVITKNFDEENVALAGNPAKIVKRNITWDVEFPQ